MNLQVGLADVAGLERLSPLASEVVPPRRARPLASHADAEARRSVLTALPCATLVTVPASLGPTADVAGLERLAPLASEVASIPEP